jgi:hypothetical protein
MKAVIVFEIADVTTKQRDLARMPGMPPGYMDNPFMAGLMNQPEQIYNGAVYRRILRGEIPESLEDYAFAVPLTTGRITSFSFRRYALGATGEFVLLSSSSPPAEGVRESDSPDAVLQKQRAVIDETVTQLLKGNIWTEFEGDHADLYDFSVAPRAADE